MRGWCFALILAVGIAADAAAQSPLKPVAGMDDLPPLNLAPMPVDGPALPNGTTVSQPLQESLPDSPASIRVVERGVSTGPIPKSWHSGEVLLWWPKAQHVPPLLSGNRFGSPTLDGPNTVLLLGGSDTHPAQSTGGRFALGWALDPAQRTGMEIAYLFTGTQTSHARVGPSRWNLGRPIINPNTGAEEVIPVNSPSMPGTFQAWASTRIQSWGVTGLTNLYSGANLRVNGLAGYRYFMVNEGLRFEQYSEFQGIDTSYRTRSADQIDAHNRFHGGELGLRTELNRGPFSVQLDTKVSLGRTVEVVRVSGQTVVVSEGFGGTATEWFPGGVLGQPSNSGRTAHSHFAVLPEGGLKLGYQLGERARFTVGYTVIYLSDAVRPGDQIDRAVDLNRVGGFGERPLPLFIRSDYWVQGVTLGLDWRY